MKKNAFTLIELIAIITILAVITIFSVPALINTLKKQEETKYQAFLENIYMATENYVVLNENKYPEINYEKGTTFIQIKDLIEKNYIKRDLVNPKTKAIVGELDTIVIMRNLDNTYSYQYYNKNITNGGYSQNGLMMHLDGYKMPQGNNWIDVSGNNSNCNFTNYNNVMDAWQKNGVLFDGVNDTCIFNKPLTPEKFSISMVLTPSNRNRRHVTFVSWHGYTFELNANNTISFGINQSPTKPYLVGGRYEFDQKNYITLTFDGVNSKIYVNGEKVAETANNPISYSTSTTVISSTTYDVFKGVIHNALFYSKALTEEEIKQNYEIDKIRFGG